MVSLCSPLPPSLLPFPFLLLTIQVARFVCVVLGWEGVQAAVGGCAEADKLAEPEQPTSSSLLHMVRREGGKEGGREGGRRRDEYVCDF